MEFDQLFKEFGDFGLYQFLIFLLIISPGIVSDTISLNFIMGRMDHWCRVPELDALGEDVQKLVAIPYGDDTADGYDGCSMFDINYGDYTEEDFLNWTRLATNTTTRECDSGWMYDRSTFIETTVSAFDLVCDRASLVPLPATIEFAGAMIGTFVAGALSDRFGRKKILTIFTFIMFVGGIISAVSPYFWVFCLGKFIQGLCGNATYVAGYVLVMELIGPKYRGLMGYCFPLAFTASYLVGALLGYLIRDFRVLQAVLICHLIVFVLLYWWLLPEPPRWLIQQDRLKEAGDVFRTLAKVNKIPAPESLDDMIAEIRDAELSIRSSEKRKTLIHLYASSIMLVRALAIDFHWFTDSMMYYALSLNAGSLSGNIYLNTALLGLVEVPAIFLGAFFVSWRYSGRRYTVSLSLVTAGVSSLILLILILQQASGDATNAMSLVGKAFVTMAFHGIYVFSAETFPTEVRHVGMGTASVCARIGGMIAPYMGPPMEQVWEPLPSMIFGACAVAAGLFLLVLPETLGLPLCQTIQEAEKRTIRGYKQMKIEFDAREKAAKETKEQLEILPPIHTINDQYTTKM